MNSFLKKNVFLVLVICFMIFSFAFPEPGLYIKKIGLLSVFTFIAMFISGLSLSLENVTGSFKNYKIIIFSACTSFVIFPAVSYLLGKVFFTNTYDAFVGAAIISTQATTVTSAIVLTMAANANVPLAIIITVINNFTSAFLSPVLLKIVLSMDKGIEFDVLGMILNLFMVLVVPIVLAQLCKLFLKGFVSFISPWRKKIANFVVLMFVLIGSSNAAAEVMKSMKLLVLVLIFSAVLHMLLLLVCYVFSKAARVSKENLPPLLFCSSQKTMTTSTMIWGNYFSQYTVAPIVIVIYHLVQLVIDTYIAGRLNKD